MKMPAGFLRCARARERITATQGVVTMVAFWAGIPPKPDQLCKLQIVACVELAAITLFTICYLAQLWHHYREVQPDAERYLAASWLPVSGHDYLRCVTLLPCWGGT